MGKRHRGVAVLLLSLLPLPALAAEQPIGRQVQTWRPRPLSPLASEAPKRAPAPTVSTPAPKPEATPLWQAWITRILSGQPIIVFQPTWKGAWPLPQNPWAMSLTPGLRGHPSAGFGPEVVVNGNWTLAGLRLEGSSSMLWAGSTGVATWRAAVFRGGWSLEVRGTHEGELRLGELGTTAAYRLAF